MSGLCFRLAFSLVTPVFHAPDEAAHFEYVRHLAEQKTLPVQHHATYSVDNDYEYHQGPLYYLYLVPFYKSAVYLFNGYVPYMVHFVHAIGFASSLVTSCVYRVSIFWKSYFKQEIYKIAILCLVTLMPSYVFLSSVLNNDCLLVVWSALVFGITP